MEHFARCSAAGANSANRPTLLRKRNESNECRNLFRQNFLLQSYLVPLVDRHESYSCEVRGAKDTTSTSLARVFLVGNHSSGWGGVFSVLPLRCHEVELFHDRYNILLPTSSRSKKWSNNVAPLIILHLLCCHHFPSNLWIPTL